MKPVVSDKPSERPAIRLARPTVIRTVGGIIRYKCGGGYRVIRKGRRGDARNDS